MKEIKLSKSILYYLVKKFPRFHIIKFLSDLNIQRFVKAIYFKFIYFFLFKINNRITLVSKENVLKYKNSTPIIYIANHASDLDVFAILSVLSHLNIEVFPLVNSDIFKNTFFDLYLNLFEFIPRSGTGEQVIEKIIRRLLKKDNVLIFPEGSYPQGKYKNIGLVQRPFTGIARIISAYNIRSKKEIIIQPICSLGMNNAYPSGSHLINANMNNKIIIKFGKPFRLNLTDMKTYEEIVNISTKITLKIAQIWGQRSLIPNVYKMQKKITRS